MFKKWFGKKETAPPKEDNRPLPPLVTRAGPLPLQFVEHNAALDLWKQKCAQFKDTGLWPMLLGPEEEVREAFGNSFGEPEDTIQQVLNESAQVNVQEFFARRKAEYLGDADEFAEDPEFLKRLEVDPTTLTLTSNGPVTLSTLDGIDEKPPKRVGFVEIPCEHPWQVFAVRPFGEWNEVPTDAEITAVLRSWNDRFGAVPIGCTLDVIELWLDSPLRDPQDAAAVAQEQFAFCADIVDQGTETLQALAQSLLGSHSWYFWWD